MENNPLRKVNSDGMTPPPILSPPSPLENKNGEDSDFVDALSPPKLFAEGGDHSHSRFCENVLKERQEYECATAALPIAGIGEEDSDEENKEEEARKRKEKRALEKKNKREEGAVMLPLHCRHLTEREIELHYARLSMLMDEIFTGKHKNIREDAYHSEKRGRLYYNTTSAMFSPKQLHDILNLIRVQFDCENIYKPLKYYVQVLVPEFCLLVFMNVHKMNREEALDYLENPPQLEDEVEDEI